MADGHGLLSNWQMSGQGDVEVAASMVYGLMLTAEMALGGEIDRAFLAIEDAIDLYLTAIEAEFGDDIARQFAQHLVRRLETFIASPGGDA